MTLHMDRSIVAGKTVIESMFCPSRGSARSWSVNAGWAPSDTSWSHAQTDYAASTSDWQWSGPHVDGVQTCDRGCGWVRMMDAANPRQLQAMHGRRDPRRRIQHDGLQREDHAPQSDARDGGVRRGRVQSRASATTRCGLSATGKSAAHRRCRTSRSPRPTLPFMTVSARPIRPASMLPISMARCIRSVSASTGTCGCTSACVTMDSPTRCRTSVARFPLAARILQ